MSGLKHYNKLDPFTVTLSFPDATASLLSGKSEIDSHFASPPFNYTELANPAIHNVLDSYEVMGGPCTLLVVYASTKFHDANPKTYHAFVAALQEAMAFINRDKHSAAELYVQHYSPKAKVADIEKMLKYPRIQYTATPKKIMKTAAFMHSVGTLGHQPTSWKALFSATCMRCLEAELQGGWQPVHKPSGPAHPTRLSCGWGAGGR